EVVAAAKGLVALGVQPGARVAIMSKTRYEWTLLDYAIWFAGAVTVPIYETSSDAQVQWILADSEATHVFVETDQHEAEVARARNETPAVVHVGRVTDADGSLVEAGKDVPD